MFGLWSGKKGGSGFPSSLTALYGEAKGDISATIDWSTGAATVVKFRPTMASDTVVGDVQIIGPLYIRAGYLVAKDGINEAVYATDWDSDTVIVAIVSTVTTDGIIYMQCGRIQ